MYSKPTSARPELLGNSLYKYVDHTTWLSLSDLPTFNCLSLRSPMVVPLLAVMVFLSSRLMKFKLWGALLRSQCIILQCDNEDSVSAINSGCSRIPGILLSLREIWLLTARHDIDIFARHITGLDNSIADHLSCWHLSPVHHLWFSALTANTTMCNFVRPWYSHHRPVTSHAAFPASATYFTD